MTYDITIVGGGIVGLSTAYTLSLKYPDKKILILEKEQKICLHQSGRNSGVIHSGIYYKPKSLKAENCIQGYHMLLKFCHDYDIPYNLCGKLIVANSDQEIAGLEQLYQRGVENGLQGLQKLSYEEAKNIEPYVICKRALFVPQTGITDYNLVGAKLLELALSRNVTIFYNWKVTSFIVGENKVSVSNNKEEKIETLKVINCAGLYSDDLGLKSGDTIQHKIMPFKGEFYKLNPQKSHLVNGLIYPVPNPEFPFLGVHMTKMMNGDVKAGPNAILAFKKEGYKKLEFNLADFWSSISYVGLLKLIIKYRKEGFEELRRSLSKKLFYKSVCQILKGVELEDITPYTAGIRAQALYQNGKLEDDFLIRQDRHFLHVYNAPSPAATACLSIGNYISETLAF